MIFTGNNSINNIFYLKNKYRYKKICTRRLCFREFHTQSHYYKRANEKDINFRHNSSKNIPFYYRSFVLIKYIILGGYYYGIL